MTYFFYKNSQDDKIWWVYETPIEGHKFSFDQKRIFTIFKDYPQNLTDEQREIFDKENPDWAEYFRTAKNKSLNENLEFLAKKAAEKEKNQEKARQKDVEENGFMIDGELQ